MQVFRQLRRTSNLAKAPPGRAFKYRNRAGYYFVLPWALGLLAFYAYPLLSSIYYSFTNYSVVGSVRWIGAENYATLFRDDVFWIAIRNTLAFTAMTVPLSVVVGISVALLLNNDVFGQGVFRTIFFLPVLVPVVAISIIWQWLLNPQFGLVNYLLEFVGISGPGWLGDPDWAKPSLVLMSLWTIGNAMLIYLAGLQDISKEYYEAAEVDGANWFWKIWHVTLPLLTPVIFFNTVMGIIHTLQEFTLPYTLTFGSGSPANSLLFYNMYLYDNAFKYLKMGYASAMAWILFIVIMGITLLMFKFSNKWVHYEE
ncbi:sugar ABC transporter permease [Paenibacillus sp.]|uniref:carbohydrate ABC transporter permease n=1 Tax=Paenibacillus sp. TaxID=58172 RepID=UPI002D32E8D4|nr:sugar ABC transporter permease [Paenibacillus sp.]HZG86427.1 sugar ABC transporter permease [Paenibacillus sp.]